MKAKEKINLLEVIPCCCEHITTQKKGEEVILSFPRFKHSWITRYLLPKSFSKEIHVCLEEHGSAVWQMIDGQRSVQNIITDLADHFHHEPGYESRISAYLWQLQKDGFIKFRILSSKR